MAAVFELSEAAVADAQKTMESGTLSSVELTVMYLNRIAGVQNAKI